MTRIVNRKEVMMPTTTGRVIYNVSCLNHDGARRVSLTRIGCQSNCFSASKMIMVMTLWTAIERVVGERSIPPSLEASYMDILKINTSQCTEVSYTKMTDTDGTPAQTRTYEPS